MQGQPEKEDQGSRRACEEQIKKLQEKQQLQALNSMLLQIRGKEAGVEQSSTIVHSCLAPERDLAATMSMSWIRLAFLRSVPIFQSVDKTRCGAEPDNSNDNGRERNLWRCAAPTYRNGGQCFGVGGCLGSWGFRHQTDTNFYSAILKKETNRLWGEKSKENEKVRQL